MIKIVVDCYGGDNSPQANIDGAVNALKNTDDLNIVFTGKEREILKHLNCYDAFMNRITVINATEVIAAEDKPTDVVKHKPETSMMKGIDLLRKDDTVSGLVSVGSSGALVAAATVCIGRLKGVSRPAFCPILPTMAGGIVGICDSGANIDTTAERMQQFAIMGSLYLENVFGIKNPRVALLNIGTESEKGDVLRKAVYPILEETESVNFVGNMESRDLLSGNYDLVVCDGFSGNVLIKSTEGTALELLKKIKKDISSKFINKIGALFMYKMFMEEKEFMNYQNYGGSVLLGTKKVVVKGHGSSDAVAVEKCIEQAYRMEVSGLNRKIEDDLRKISKKIEKN